MKLAVPLKQFRNDLDRYLKLIESGAEIEITKYDKPFTSVVSAARHKPQAKSQDAVGELLGYLDAHDFSGNFPKGVSTKKVVARARMAKYPR